MRQAHVLRGRRRAARAAAAARRPRQGRHAARPAGRGRARPPHPGAARALRRHARARPCVAALARRSSSSGSGCSSRSSPASSCCRPRSTSSRRATIVVPLGTWFGHQVGLTAQGLHGGRDHHLGSPTSISLVVLADPHDAVDAAAGRAAGARACRGCSSSCSAWPTATCSMLLDAVDGHVHRSHGADGRPGRDAASGRRVRGRLRRRAVRQGAQRCRTRCTWRWSPAATAATRARSTAFRITDARRRRGPSRAVGSRHARSLHRSATVPLRLNRCSSCARPARTPTSSGSPRSTTSRSTVARGREGGAARRQRLRQVDAAEGARRAASSPTAGTYRGVRRSGHRGHASRTSSSPRASAAGSASSSRTPTPRCSRRRCARRSRSGRCNMGLAARRGRGSGSTTCWRCSTSPTWPTARRTSCRAARRSASRSPRCS